MKTPFKYFSMLVGGVIKKKKFLGRGVGESEKQVRKMKGQVYLDGGSLLSN